MKTKNFFPAILIVISALALTMASCQKEEIKSGKNDNTTMSSTSEDEIAVQEITDESLEDVEGFLSNHNENGNLKSGRIPCNATIDSTEVINDTITIFITYDGLSCNGRFYRTGQVEIRKRVGSHFGRPGATVNVRYINFHVTRVGSERSITINGSKTFTNVTGGFMFMLGHNGFNTLIHRIEGRMNVAFNDGTSRSWYVARQRTFTGTRGNFVLTVDGFGTMGDRPGMIIRGINRDGQEFVTFIHEPVVHKQTCNWNPVSGIKTHSIINSGIGATITFGYDSNEQPVTGDECPTHYRVDWINGSYTGTRYLPLP